MSPEPTGSDFLEGVQAERTLLADVVEGLSNEQWRSASACGEWSIGEVVWHLMIVDGSPLAMLRPLRGLPRLKGPFGWMDGWQKRQARRHSPADSARLLRSRLPAHVKLFKKAGGRYNLPEEIVHTEDVLRPLGVSRTHQPPERPTMSSLALVAAWQLRKLRPKGTVRFEAGSGCAIVLDSSRGLLLPAWKWAGTDISADVVVRGEVVELLLFITGRRSDATVEGEGDLADGLRSGGPAL